MRNRIFIFLFSLPLLLFGKIVESNRLADILPSIDASTWVILDIDHTLIEPAQQLGSAAWRETYLRDKFIRMGHGVDDATNLARRQWSHVQPYIRMRAVETSTPGLIRSLQDRGIMVLALTARSTNQKDLTNRQLQQVGITFSHSLLPARFIPLIPKKPIGYDRGVIFAGWQKDIALETFFTYTPIRPRSVVYVDDRIEHLKRVQEALLCKGINFSGFHYLASADKTQPIDPEIVELQWATFPNPLSDDKALEMINKRDD